MSKRDFASDDVYNAGIPDFSDAQVAEIYRQAGVDILTGLPIVKSTSGKVGLASGKLSAGVLTFDAPVWAFMATARACNCMTCRGILENIYGTARAYRTAETATRKRQRMEDIKFFIGRLRSVVMSAYVNHNRR